jgi:ribonuclease HII
LRLDPDFSMEQDYWDHGYRFVAGVDEVGRGCLAGPVMVGAVILPPGWLPDGLRDSKILKADARERLADEILLHAVAWALAAVEPAVIDRVNILQATLLAAQLAASRLPVRPDALLLDGTLYLDGFSIPQRVVVDGDRLCASIAAASILAKVARDRLMVELDGRFPGYDLAHNKGYAAPEHRAGLREHGTTPIHRLSFASCAEVEQTVLWEAVGPGVDEEAFDDATPLDTIDEEELVR